LGKPFYKELRWDFYWPYLALEGKNSYFTRELEGKNFGLRGLVEFLGPKEEAIRIFKSNYSF